MRAVCLAAVATWALSCGAPASKTDVPRTAPGPATGRAIEYLHDTTELVVGLTSLDSPAAAALSVVVPEARELLAELIALADDGIDTKAPAGFALVDLDSRTAVAFATVTDQDRLRSTIAATGAASVADDGLIVIRSDTEAAVIRGDQLFLIRAPAPSRRDLAAVRIATVTRAESLAQRPSFRAAVSNLEAGADAAGYMSMASAARDMLGRIELWEFDLADLAARPTTDDPRQRAWIETALRVAEAEKHLATDVLGALGGIGFGAEEDGATLATSITAEPAAASLAARLLAVGPTTLRLPGAMGPNARFVAAAHTDVDVLVEFVSVAMAGFGLDSYGIEKTLEQLLGIDIAQDVLPALTGEVGFAIDADNAVHVALGLDDPSALKKALGADGARIDIGVVVYVQIVGDQLVATTDPRFFDRFAKATPADAKAPAMVSIGAGELDFLFHNGHTAPVRTSIIDRDENDDVPFSPAYLAVEQTLRLTEAALVAADRAVTVWHEELARARARPFGVLTLVATPSAGWLRASGGLRLDAESFGDALERSAAAVQSMAADREALEAEVERLIDERARLADELVRIRVADIQAADSAATQP